MTWSRAHRRHQLVHEVLAEIARDRRPEIPDRWAGEIEAEFGGFGEFLRDVQARWYRTFEARIDPLLESGAPDMRAALDAVWHELAGDMPGARLLLDAHVAHPALAELHDRRRRLLHLATGLHWDPAAATPAAVPRPRHASTPRAPRRTFKPCLWIIAPGGIR
ncbi:hypothetical protein [Spirillospora sp. NPDC047279]|uniref:hypothetical protein n=1 Tax=Spirillospora sp. NPDC047279 TaxID=3155478 RepID=UPI0033F7553C